MIGASRKALQTPTPTAQAVGDGPCSKGALAPLPQFFCYWMVSVTGVEWVIPADVPFTITVTF